jgi:hypothetical protein
MGMSEEGLEIIGEGADRHGHRAVAVLLLETFVEARGPEPAADGVVQRRLIVERHLDDLPEILLEMIVVLIVHDLDQLIDCLGIEVVADAPSAGGVEIEHHDLPTAGRGCGHTDFPRTV